MAVNRMTNIFGLLILGSFLVTGMPGGWSEMDRKSPEALQMANMVFTNDEMKSNRLYSAQYRLKSVHTQVVAGTNYRLVFDVGTTDCRRSGQTLQPIPKKDGLDCKIQQVRECTVVVYQHWNHTIPASVMSEDCTEDSPADDNLNIAGFVSVQSQRPPTVENLKKPPTVENTKAGKSGRFQGLLSNGRLTDLKSKSLNLLQPIMKRVGTIANHAAKKIQPTNEKKKQPIDEDMQKIMGDLPNAGPKQDKEGHKLTEGMVEKLQAFNVVKPVLRRARSVVGKLGRQQEVQVGDEGILSAVDFAMESLNAKSNAMYRAVPYDIVNPKKQMVAGTKYIFTMKIGVSKQCRNNKGNHHKTVKECPLDVDSKKDECDLEVLHQPWMDLTHKLLKFECKTSHTSDLGTNTIKMSQKKPMLGGDDHDDAHYGVYEMYKAKYNKQYEKEEDMKRFKIFRDNMKKIKQLQKEEMGSGEYGATEFADMTYEEFIMSHGGFKWDKHPDPSLMKAEIPPMFTLPASYDWRDHNAVTEVKNQGSCGSCWAFSTTGNIEGQWAIKKKQLISLSEQELVDCDKLDEGCNGGLPTNAYKEIMRLGGLETEKQYPYEGDDETCHFNKQDVDAYITGAVNISSNETEMAMWLAKNGPISIGINAMAMQFYFGGVSHPWKIFCDPESLDHGVLIVGYGTAKGWFSDKPYWIVKNSWGTSWGEQGYYRVYRGDGTCGVNQMPTSAVINK